MAEFEPTRLSVARRRRGITQRELAEKCNVTNQYISAFERGQEFPTPEMVQKIANILRFPLGFFYEEPVELIATEALSFRAKRSMSSSVRDMGLGAGDIAASIIARDLDKRFNLPKSTIPDLRKHSPEEAADILRAQWNLTYEPIQNMVHLLESKGVLVFWVHNESPSLDAVSFWKNARPFVLLNSLKDSGDRGRFDAAHELGHLVLHRDYEVLDSKQVEDEADEFASAFLLPSRQFERECLNHPDFNHLYQLKTRWKVSIAAMIMRGAQLGIFSEWQKRQAFQKLNATGMRTREKVAISREQSKLHPMVFDSLQSKRISPFSYANILSLEVAELQELMPTMRTYVTNQDLEPKEIRRGHLRLILGGKSTPAV